METSDELRNQMNLVGRSNLPSFLKSKQDTIRSWKSRENSRDNSISTDGSNQRTRMKRAIMKSKMSARGKRDLENTSNVMMRGTRYDKKSMVISNIKPLKLKAMN